MPQPNRRLLAAAAAGAAALVVAAIIVTSGGGEPDGETRAGASKTPSTSPVPVIVPGRPGQAASTVMSDELRAPDGTVHNLPDIYFMRMMIPHHTQALEMAVLAPERTTHPQLLAIADRVRAAQLPEIAYMRSWLDARGLKVDDPGHDHGTMPGMQTRDRLDALKAARGDAFDRLFIDMMISHHQGAIRMATDVLRAGKNDQVEELANNIAAEQDVEIGRMREAFPA
ncbi:DUF305 domain-containing protein [Virgisporangium ochraceum]|uniref:Lipoprotein n=1 Tax=Virgisporangium ochraceum TaxID=65505 RepID=A0A8J3ZU38_9ACTN|nr:DUF305 domain-containing protein [Virgisporangium ochraceum]GIJ69123.1 lipoprotein [Virgisporangium ochraceum]